MIIALQTIDPGVVEELIDTRSVTGWDYLWAALTVLAAFLVAWLLKRGLSRGLAKVHGIPPRYSSLITTATTWSIRLLGIVFALPFLGVDITPFVIFILVIIALMIVAGRVILENYGAGLILQTRAPFKIDDDIATLQYEGTVREINARAVVLITPDGRRVSIPNSSVLSNPIETLTAHELRRSDLTVGVEYGTDLDRARDVLVAAVEAIDGVAVDPAPQAFVVEYAESAIDFEVWFWHESDILSGIMVTDEVARAINRALRAAGIVIAFPQRTLWWGDKARRPPDPTD